MKAARYLGKIAGKRAYRFPVEVHLNDSRACATLQVLHSDCISHSAAEAANWAREIAGTRPETEIIVYGPKGGETRRFIGWESAIGNRMIASWDAPKQGRLL